MSDWQKLCQKSRFPDGCRRILKSIRDLRHETAIWILIFLMDFTELLKDLTKNNQVYFLLHNQNLLNGCSGLPALMDKLLAQDPSWKNLKTEYSITLRLRNIRQRRQKRVNLNAKCRQRKRPALNLKA